MNLGINDTWIDATFHFGFGVDEIVRQMKEKAIELNCIVRYKMNNVVITVAPDSDANLVIRDCMRVFRTLCFTVGPYPKDQLTAQELAIDAYIVRTREDGLNRESAERAAENLQRAAAVRTKVDGTPPMIISDTEGWDDLQRRNPRGSFPGLVHAEMWARLMQDEMASGKTLEEVFISTSEDVNSITGLSGNDYYAAVRILMDYWVHGDEVTRLRKKQGW